MKTKEAKSIFVLGFPRSSQIEITTTLHCLWPTLSPDSLYSSVVGENKIRNFILYILNLKTTGEEERR